MMIYLILIALLLTTSILISGLIVMFKGGGLNKKYGNMLMRWRIFAQGITVLLLGIVYFMAKH